MTKNKIKVCPECKTEKFLCDAWEQDGTTDCMSCTGNFEEYELILKEDNDTIKKRKLV